jgi:hypothetical protein
MAMTLWTTAALVLWLVLWALGSKPLDAFLIPIVIILVGATLVTLRRFMPNRR